MVSCGLSGRFTYFEAGGLMHYYSHNIADYRKDTGHLSLLEHGIYRQLLDTYYLDEKPIETQSVIRRLSIKTKEEKTALENVLSDFFILSDCGNYHHQDRCDKEIVKYQGRAEAARVNGSKGGRPKKPKKTQSVNSANPEITKGKANHKPITNNHKPITNTKDYGAIAPDFPPDVVQRFVEHRKNIGHPAKTDHVIKLGLGNLQACVDRRLFVHVADAMDYLEKTEWKTLKPEYVENQNGKNRKSSQFDAASVITSSAGARDTSCGF